MSTGHKRAKTLDDIFNDDDAGLLDDVAPLKKSMLSEDKLKLATSDLYTFIQTNRRLPYEGSADFEEWMLSAKLSGFQKSDPKLFLDFQNYALSLKGEQADTTKEKPEGSPEEEEKIYSSLDDIFDEDDDLGLLDVAESSLPVIHKSSVGESEFSKKHKAKYAKYVAKYRPCQDFDRYEAFFAEINAQLKAGSLKAVRYSGYKTKDLNIGQIFMLSGMLVIVADLDKENAEMGSHRYNYRMHLIYSNQTEVDPIVYTFMESLNIDDRGSQIVPVNEAGREFMEDLKRHLMKLKEIDIAAGRDWHSNAMSETKQKQNVSGYIYILKSLSTHPSLLQFKQGSALIKIGFCITSVEERIKNAKNEPTYLYADVEVVDAFPCSNIDPHQFERLVHAILVDHRLNVTLQDQSGKLHQPREWFTVRPETAKEVVHRILDKSIVNYRVNKITGKLVPRNPS